MVFRATWDLRNRPLPVQLLKLRNLLPPAKWMLLMVYAVGMSASTRHPKPPIVFLRPSQLLLQERGLSSPYQVECLTKSVEYFNVAIGTTRTWLFSWYARNYCALPSLACATTKIEELIATGQMEGVQGICRWIPSLDAFPQVMYRVLAFRSNATSRKKPSSCRHTEGSAPLQ